MSHKIYFCGSVGGGYQDRELYLRIIDQLHSYGEVVNEMVFKVVTDPQMVGVTDPSTGKLTYVSLKYY